LDNRIFSVKIPARVSIGTKLVKNVENVNGWIQGFVGSMKIPGLVRDMHSVDVHPVVSPSDCVRASDTKDLEIQELKSQVQLLQKEKLDLQISNRRVGWRCSCYQNSPTV
jgi:hypothetical protein